MTGHDASKPPGAVTPDVELVVLLDEQRRPIGESPKSAVHTPTTPLHLAFSLYLFDAGTQVLMTRRALTKRTWPGVWTNSCCGHPGPAESMTAALDRRLSAELGVRATNLRMMLPDFAYRAADAGGIVENEFCPVFIGRIADPWIFAPDPDEVAEHAWVEWADLVTAVRATPFAFSPWAVAQVTELGPVFDRARALR